MQKFTYYKYTHTNTDYFHLLITLNFKSKLYSLKKKNHIYKTIHEFIIALILHKTAMLELFTSKKTP